MDWDMNEDGVPLNEKDIENNWIDFGIKAGMYAHHVENIGRSLPDVLMMWKGIAIFHETKMQRGNLLYFPQFQHANFMVMRHACHQWQLSVVAWKAGMFSIYSMQQIKEAGCEAAGEGKVKVNVGLLTPQFAVTDFESFEQYLEWLRPKIWKKKT